MAEKQGGDSENERAPKRGLFRQLFSRKGETGHAPGDGTGGEDLALDAEAETAPQAPGELAAAAAPLESQRRGWWARLRQGLSRTSGSIWEGFSSILSKRKLDAETLEDLEDVLIRADLGVATAARISKAIGQGRYDKNIEIDEVKEIVAREIEEILAPYAKPFEIELGKKPFVVLVIGVNGFSRMPFLAAFAEAKLRNFVKPGDTLEITATLMHDGSGFARTKAEIRKDGKPTCSAEITFRVVEFPSPEFRRHMEDAASAIAFPMQALHHD